MYKTKKELFDEGFRLYKDNNPEVWTLDKDNSLKEVYIYHKSGYEHLKAINYKTRIEFLDRVSESTETA